MEFLLSILVAISVFLVPQTAVSESSPNIEKFIQESSFLAQPSKQPENTVFCSCIVTARYLGLPLPKTPYAGDLEPNTELPIVGEGILLSYPSDEHVAIILAILEEGYWIGEGNFRRCKYTERFIPFDDNHIRGFIKVL